MLSQSSFASRTSPWAYGTSALLNGSLLAILFSLGLGSVAHHASSPVQRSAISLDAPFWPAHGETGGQGAGARDSVDASRGHLPRVEKMPLAPPQVPMLDQPKLAVNSAMLAPSNVRLPDDPSMANIGLPHSPNITVVSGGRGSHNGIGNGDASGVGNGHHGIGFGPTSGDDVYTPGGDVSAPVPLVTPEAEFSDEARRQKFQGVCLISVIIDARGLPQNPRILRRLGMGLDEKALDAVQRYRFKPALKQGRPVASRITVAVNFRLF